MKPGTSSTGRRSPGGTPRPRKTGLRRSAAASKPMRDSRQSGGTRGRAGKRDIAGPVATPRIPAVMQETLEPAPTLDQRSSPPDSDASRRGERAGGRYHPRPMRAATIRDSSIGVEEHPDPVPGDSDLLVRVRGAGLNGADMHQLKGRYPAPPGAPQDIPGLELAGEVLECGPGVQRFVPGDRVMAIVAGGGQAELA